MMWDALPDSWPQLSIQPSLFFEKNPIITGKKENKGWEVGLVQGIKRKRKGIKGNEKERKENTRARASLTWVHHKYTTQSKSPETSRGRLKNGRMKNGSGMMP